jgi:hypothetical protein
MVGFLVSLVYVSLLADLILDCVKFCGDAIGMSQGLEVRQRVFLRHLYIYVNDHCMYTVQDRLGTNIGKPL